jgi:outer membrane protein assembly factor BamB
MIPLPRLYLTLLALLAWAAPSWAQFPSPRIFSRPTLPSADTLRRLDLHLAWTTALPMDGKRDALYSIVLEGKDLFVLSRSGQIARLDAETGVVRWKSRPGRKYTTVPYMAVNSQSVFLVLNATLYSINRERGLPEWEYPLPGGLATAPIVDNEQIYIPRSDGFLTAFSLPFITLTRDGQPTLSPVYGQLDPTGEVAPRPRPMWSIDTQMELAFPPVQTTDSLFIVDPSGKAKGLDKINRTDRDGLEFFRIAFEGKVRHRPGYYGNMVFVGSDDTNLYALDMTRGKLTWRYTAGSPVSRSPAVLENEVFVTSEREGMVKLDRATGDTLWRIPHRGELLANNPDADQFLAASSRFVYALDSADRLVILDRRRGVTLATLDKRDFRYPIVNQVTDRLYLAANDGTIVCLHDRLQPTALRHRKKLEDAAAAIHKILDFEVEERPRPVVTLEEMLNILKDNYGVRYKFARAELEAAALADIGSREINFRGIDRRPLRNAYNAILKQVGAGFRIEENTLLVVPEKNVVKDPMDPKGPKEPKEPKDDDKDPKDDDKDARDD